MHATRELAEFEILSEYVDTARYLDDVRKAADLHRNSLGFFPASVFDEFARRGHLLVLVEQRNRQPCYVGHLMFDRRFPRARVVQMFTISERRRCGLATKLVNHLISELTRDGFTSIYARVAEDLVDANAFWEREDFYVQRIEQGRSVRHRQILVRCHELESPQLFPSSGINSGDPLGLGGSSADVIPLYLLDLNVLFDLGPRRLRREEALALFQAERMNFCRLAISNEVRRELDRTAQKGKTDPMEDYISIFPSFPLFHRKSGPDFFANLASLVFPDKQIGVNLNPNDLSDLRHIATAIEHNLAGLITNDNVLLAAAPQIVIRYGVEIVSPAAFKLDSSTAPSNMKFETHEESILALKEVSSQDEQSVRTLLSILKLSGSKIASGWMPTEAQPQVATRRAVWDGSNLVAYSTCSARDASGHMRIRCAVNEENPQSFNAARILLAHLLERLSSHGPCQLTLELASRQSIVRDVASGFGFCRAGDENCMRKLLLGRVLTEFNWSTDCAELARKTNLKLPDILPPYQSMDQQIRILTPDGNQRYVALGSLESLLSPALFCLSGRPAVVTPIRRDFAEMLIGHSPQQSLLPSGKASLYQERHYLSDSRTLGQFRRGVLILFYESTKSGGRGEIVAIARVRQAYLMESESLDKGKLKQSALTERTLANIGKSRMKTVTVFDNLFPLPQTVPLESLRRIGHGRPSDLITTKAISDLQLREIIKEAFGYE